MKVDVCHLIAVNALQLGYQILLLWVEVLKVFKASTLRAIDFVQIIDKEALTSYRILEVFFRKGDLAMWVAERANFHNFTRQVVFIFRYLQQSTGFLNGGSFFLWFLLLFLQIDVSVLQLLLACNSVQGFFLIVRNFVSLPSLPEWSSWGMVITLFAWLSARLIVAHSHTFALFLYNFTEQLRVDVLVKLLL